MFFNLFKSTTDPELEAALKTENVKVIDVRTPDEFSGGHVAGSINIPLNELPQAVVQLKKLTVPMVLCCASGMRSGKGTAFLKENGIENVFNGGAWTTVNRIVNN
jgi:rhodanese-related sulfurtransferase